MARSPSLLALLGLAAVAGYQNRDKLGAMVKEARQPGAETKGGLTGLLGGLFNATSGATSGAGLSGGINELVDRFRTAGIGQKAESWVSSERNVPLEAGDIEKVIDTETLDELVQKTGLSRAELLQRLGTALPETVDQFTPQGRIPTDDEARGMY
jgi:uncharacterized protein YidB (DUF937 family)